MLLAMIKNTENGSKLSFAAIGLGLVTLQSAAGFGSPSQQSNPDTQLSALSTTLNNNVRLRVKQPVTQKNFDMVFNYIVKRDDGGLLNKNSSRILLSQSTPPGYINDIFQEGRDFPQQLVEKISFSVNGKEIRFEKDPETNYTNYWTIRKNPREVRDISQIRIILDAPSSKELVISARYDGVWAQQLAVDTVREGDIIPALPQQEITQEQRSRYTRPSEPGMNLRPDEFKPLMQQRNLVWDKSKETEVQFLTRVANFISKYPSNPELIETDMQKLLRDGGALQCNSESMLATSILRMNGFPTRITSGWVLSGKVGHAITQVYSDSLKQWLDFAGVTPVGKQSPTLRFDISFDIAQSNGKSFGAGVSSSGLMIGYEMNEEGRGPRFQVYTGFQFDAANSKVTDLKEGDAGWMDATPRKDTGDVLVQGEKANAQVTGSWKVETPDWFFYLGEGRYAFLRNGNVGDQVTFKAPVRDGQFTMKAMFMKHKDQGVFDVSINGGAPKRIDLYSPDLKQELINLGPVVSKDGTVTINFKLVGTNPAALKIGQKDERGEQGGMLSFDYARFEPVEN
jgi:hypothetical protein